MMQTLRCYLIAGLLIWVPLGITVFVIRVMVGLMDQTILLIPPQWRPEALLGFNIPGLGVVLVLVIVLLTGMIVANILGRKLVGLWDAILSRIPLVRTIHSAVKQVMETILNSGSKSFRKVMLIEYPRKGVWTLAFQTGEVAGEIRDKAGVPVVTVFVPTTPNPTSGFVIIVPKEELIELDMPVEEGLKLIMSLGVVSSNGESVKLSEEQAENLAKKAS
jgi:uncharacterized membrane protein